MNRLFVSGLVLASCLAAALSLCTPDQWEGYAGGSGAYLSASETKFFTPWNRVSYDAINKRKAAFISYGIASYQTTYQKVERYDKDGSGRLYLVDLKTGSCWTKKLEGPFKKFCVPAQAMHLCDTKMGLKDKGFPISIYILNQGDVNWTFSVNKVGQDTIYPIGENHYHSDGKSTSLEPLGHMDITPGIKNATVFDVPPQCVQMEKMSVHQLLTKEQFAFGF